ncbi:uncharacterized protein TrAtP1_000449 [Trichoderma atroviride]|uniref:uncharacterized protein n=1 Tax=Hypocrea atroviridis TaxID=63577 RepID=UPI00332454AE|nr:hypothetical protein TrAtP1_000449 [Trichoderma atroviride]
MAPLELERTPAHLTTHQTAGTGTQYPIRKKKKKPPPALRASQRRKKKTTKEKKMESSFKRHKEQKPRRQVMSLDKALGRSNVKRLCRVKHRCRGRVGDVFDSFHVLKYRPSEARLLAAGVNQRTMRAGSARKGTNKRNKYYLLILR